MNKRCWLGLLASILGGSGAAVGQGYYYPSYGYPAYGPPPVPIAMTAPAQPLPSALHGMPGGYATPYYPGMGMGRATVSEAPKVHGWPPLPGAIPAPPVPSGVVLRTAPPQTAAPAASSDGRLAPIPVTSGPAGATISPVSKTTQLPPITPPAEPVAVLPDSYLPTHRLKPGQPKHGHKQPGPAVQTLPDACGSDCSPCQPLIDPCPGTPLMCVGYAPAPQPFVHPLPERAPRGYCGYARLEYLYWWIDPQDSPSLFVYRTIRGVNSIDASELDNGERQGGRFTAGFWLNPQLTWGLEASYMQLADRHPSFITDAPTISRLFIDSTIGQPTAVVVAAPGVATGSARAESDMRYYQCEVNSRYELCRFSCGHIDVLGGFRHCRLEEELKVSTSSVPGTGFLLTNDIFDTDNQFFGGQLGLEGEVNYGCFFINASAKCAVGHNRQFVTIAGSRLGSDGGDQGGFVPGGLLAVPTNIGSYRKGEFCYIPEVGLNVGVKLCANMRLTAGYSVLFLSNVVRPGDQINVNINPTQLQAPGGPPAAPVGTLGPFFNAFNESSLWAHGASVGLEVRW